jgi:hypothetical protein
MPAESTNAVTAVGRVRLVLSALFGGARIRRLAHSDNYGRSTMEPSRLYTEVSDEANPGGNLETHPDTPCDAPVTYH